MRLGFGSTVLANGLDGQGLDGIGYYAQELGNSLAGFGVDLAPVVFGPARGNPVFNTVPLTLPRFKYGLASGLLGINFPGSQSLRAKIDLYHATDHLIPRLKGTPVVATIMDAIPLAHPEWVDLKLRRLKNSLWRRTVAWSDHVITISDHSKKDLIEFFNIPSQKITVIPLGVDQRYFDAVDLDSSKQYLIKTGLNPRHYFLFVGTLQPRKNVERLLDAYASLPDYIKKEIPLVIVGREGWGCESLVARLARNALQENSPVQWLKNVTDLEKRILMQNATALVFPSLYEGFGLPVVEAFASGLPVITSNTTSLVEVARDAALLIDPVNIDQLAHAMKRMIEEDTLRATLKNQGLARARTYTWQQCASQTMAVYCTVLGS